MGRAWPAARRRLAVRRASGAGLDLHVGPRDRLALIGRNGAGKTTLLRLIANEIEATGACARPSRARNRDPGTGTRLFRPHADGFRAGRRPRAGTARGGGHRRAARHRHGHAQRHGQRRRAAPRGARRALAQDPDLLLLDEPTNHLDLAAIDWLEGWLERYRGAFIVISHDRTFLTRLTRATMWLDRGNLRRKEVGFGGYEAWEEQVYAEEARNADRLDAKLKLEAHWLERGVTARRKRNQGRLAKLWEMRAARAAMINPAGAAKLQLASDDRIQVQVGDRGGRISPRLTANARSSSRSPCASSAATGSALSARTARARPRC
jgi:ABC transport system ATP-binding/permease protein